MSAQDPKLRNLKIKTGVVKRLTKEKQMYEKELKEQEEKISKMQSEGKDEYDVRKQIECKNESAAMIPDCKRRLKTASDELSNILATDFDLAESKEYQDAKAVMEEANKEI